MSLTPCADTAVDFTSGWPHPTPGTDAGEHCESWHLVYTAQRGDSCAFGQLYSRHVDGIYRYLLVRGGSRELAEDLTSETFLRALRGITSVSYQGRGAGAWLITIARNLLLDHVKSGRHRREVTTAVLDADSPLAEPGPEQRVIASQVTDTLLCCVNQLGEDQRECVVLRFLVGLSVAEAAEVMNRSTGALKALQHRAVQRLAELVPAGLR